MVLLVSRVPFVEQVVGKDGLLRWHRRLAPWPISLLIAHALLLVAGYAQAARSGPWHEVNTLLFSYPDVLIATIGLGLMCLAGVMSIRAIRRRVRRRSRILLIAAGIGVTAVRALLEDLPRSARPVVLLRATQRADLVLGTEIADLVKRRGGQLHELTGNRMTASIDQYSLRHTVPDLNERDLYVCGPEAFVTSVVEVARSLGLPDEAIHHEAFAL